MSCDWGRVPLSSLGKIVTGKTPPSKVIDAFVNGSVPFVTPRDLDDRKWIKTTERYLSNTGLESVKGNIVPAHSVAVSCIGSDMGKARLLSVKSVTNQQINTILVNSELHNPEYIYYVLSTKQQSLKDIAGGSATPILNKSHFGQFEIDLPSKGYQNAVVDVLRGLDSKIEINTQTNQTLEQMAQAIFKSWFVDFDPVKAKMNGEQPEGMDAATASLFPEKLDSETGIPVGWSQGIIADIAKLNAKSWTKKNQPEQVHYVDLANTKNGVIETVTTYDFDEAPSRARRVLNSGDTIVGTVRPGNRSFAFIGETEQPLTGSTGFAVLSPKEEFWTSFVYLATTNDDAIDEYARLADGGAYPAIKPVVVADTPCVIPTTDIAQKFWQLTGAMLKKAHQNRLENEELAKLRDTLLPKLLSGEIELGETEEMAEVN
ncbi:restriction endonuclease subunit S (plasmid) [Proteus terrae subsp. cibarius]|uniref:Restriction endonuclease subunit S n=1 Tax=Proteus terrae subsp. cibarius TaxID=626774 RepID=A0ABX6JT37_9GAMM|nr:restriction endonuclease subunit S [Proteus terrae]QGW05260.1 restriction endonuclease subunit S [Proteus terrae subsp. cibarius]QIF92355.1 restriction endonuclease subunit S [Proteus terrae subsp. cibarius]